MDYHIRGSPFKDQFVIPQTPTPNIPTHLNPTALHALPYISLLIGIDALTPTKAVYALYDPSIACIRFVHGDGKFVNTEQVCFRNSFKDGVPNLNRRQRLHFLELMHRSVEHYRLLNAGDGFRARVEREFPTESSVKANLTFMCDLKQGSCPALSTLPPVNAPQSVEELQDQAMPCIHLTALPTWDFNPKRFQAFATQEMEVGFSKLYGEYCSKYNSKIIPIDFQHALFCLNGLMKVGLIPFILEGQNNPKFFIPNNVTPPLPPKNLMPRKTSSGWTVDCFIARFGKFEEVFNGGYQQWPNPIAWLEAEMEYEERQNRMIKPWRLIVEKGAKETTDPPVIAWEKVLSLKWHTREDYTEYPKPLILKENQPLELHDIINPLTGKFKESKRAKKDRKEQEKAARGSNAIDLTETNAASGHMNQPATRRTWNIECPMDDLGSGYTGDESELASPIYRKRKRGANDSHNLAHRLDSDEEPSPSLEQLRHEHRFKQEDQSRVAPQADLYDSFDWETDRREASLRKRVRHQSPPLKKFKNPLDLEMFSTQISDQQENLQFSVRTGPTAVNLKAPYPVLKENSGMRGSYSNCSYNTSSPGSGSDYVETFETLDLPKHSPLKSQNRSPNKPNTSGTSLGNQLKTNMHKRCDAFEDQHRTNNFDERLYRRLYSPSSSSPEAQQNLFPSIERSPALDKTSDRTKSINPKNKTVIELDSLESDGDDAGDIAGQSWYS